MHQKIKQLSENRIKYFIENPEPFYKWYKTYFDAVKDEFEEVEEQLKDNNSVYLEDELWDVFWDYMCLLYSLKSEWKITSVEKVFERAYKKLSERIWNNWKNNWDWQEIKKKQKEELKLEHNKIYPK